MVTANTRKEVRRMTETQTKRDEIDWSPVAVGDVVEVITENYETVKALVTTVHGSGWTPEGTKGYGPSINAVYVSTDASKHDPYGTQLERYSSLVHYNGTLQMPKSGRCWRNIQ
jgi:hypothetical protein